MANGQNGGPNLGQHSTNGINISSGKLTSLSILGSFVGIIFCGGIAYNNLSSGIEQSFNFQSDTKERLGRLDTDRANAKAENQKRIADMLDIMNNQKNTTDSVIYQIGQLQKADEAADNRVDRMSDSYGGRFSEMNEKMNALSTQQALTNQTLSEIRNIVGQLRGDKDQQKDHP